MKLDIRPAEARDIDELMVLDAECFKNPWSRNLLFSFLGSTQEQLYVLEGVKGKIYGFLAIQHGHRWVKIVRLCVGPENRRKTIGTLALGWLKRSLINYQDMKKTQLRAVVRPDDSSNLAFFKANDFCAVSVFPQFFKSNGYFEDGILLRWSVNSESNDVKAYNRLSLNNRISKHFNA